VDFAWVDVEEQGTGGGEDSVRLGEAWAQEPYVIREDVGVSGRGGRIGIELFGAITMAAKASTIAVGVANRAQARPLLRRPRVERRIDVDELDARVSQRAQSR
jgi:hypothetical protein